MGNKKTKVVTATLLRVCLFLLIILFLPALYATEPVIADGGKPLHQDRYSTVIAQRYITLGRFYTSQGAMLKALHCYTMALKSLSPAQGAEEKYLEYCLAVSNETLSLADGYGSGFNNPATMLIFKRYLSPVFERAIFENYLLYQITGNEKYPHQALMLAERSKAVSLSWAVKHSRAARFSGVPDSLIALQRKWSSEITALSLSMEGNDDAAPANLKTKMSGLLDRLDSLTDILRKEYPAYHHLTHSGEFMIPVSLKNFLSPSQAIFEFYSGDSVVYICMATGKHTSMIRIENGQAFHSQIQLLLKSVISRDYKNYTAVAEALWKQIFGDFESYTSGVNTLLIVPDGAAGLIPFEALLTDKADGSGSYSKLPYSIRTHRILYAPSLENFLIAFHDKQTELNNDITLFTPGFDKKVRQQCFTISGFTDSTWLGLRELKASAALLNDPPPNTNVIKYSGTDASEQKLRNPSNKTSFLHLATHTIADSLSPMESFIYLAPSDTSDEAHNGRLYAWEIFGIQTSAQTVVLGSCSSGLGTYSPYQGIISLAYAFSYAGSPSVVYTIWDVDDMATRRLFEIFYREIALGKSVAEALHQARIKYIDQAGDAAAAPYYWAGIILTGHPGITEKTQSKCLSYIIIPAICIIVLPILIVKKIRRKQRK